MVVEGLHGQVKAPVLREEAPGLHIPVRLWEGLYVHGADLMGPAVIEHTGFRGVGLIPDAPGDLKAEEVLLPLFIGNPPGAVSPVPDEGVGRTHPAPVQNAEAVGLAEVPAFVPVGDKAFTGQAVLLRGHKIAVRISRKGQDGRNVLQPRKNVHGDLRPYVPVCKLQRAAFRPGVRLKDGLPHTEMHVVGRITPGRQNIPVLPADKRRHTGEQRLPRLQVHQDGGGIAAQGNIGKADLKHQAAVGNLIEIPFLPAQHMLYEVPVIPEHILPRPALCQQRSVLRQQGRRLPVFPLLTGLFPFQEA